MSYSRRRSRKASSWKAWVIVGICMLCLIAYALIRGMYSWITEARQRADTVTVKITNTGFEPHSIALSANQRLHIVNASSRAVVLCLGLNQVCRSSAKAASVVQATPTATPTPANGEAMPGEGLTIPPDGSYDLSFKNGNYDFTIGSSTQASSESSDDLQVTMQGGSNSSVGSDDEDNGVSVSSSSSSDDEENSNSNSTSGSSSGGSDDDSGGSGGSSGGDDGGGGSGSSSGGSSGGGGGGGDE
jgi:hypothetical protein